MRTTAGALVYADPKGGASCPQCDEPMHVRKTLRRNGQTLEHGAFRVRETVYVCGNRCVATRPSVAGAHATQAGVLTRRSESLAQLLLPRRAVGYDVMTFIGLQRFVHHRQREEIRKELENRHGVRLSSGEISSLAQDFVVYLEALHQRRSPSLRAALAQDGGWPMHIDATGEDGRGTLLVVYAGWRGWVLGSWKIPTERADAILPRLRQVAEGFGSPCAIMRDLGRAMIEASRDFVKERALKIPVLGCHFHFLRDIGKDLLEPAHDQLRGLFRRFNVRGTLRALTRDLGRQFGTDAQTVRRQLHAWLDQDADGHELPPGATGVAVVRALAQWVLDHAADGHDDGFPFDLPYLDLWRRGLKALRAVEAFLRTPGTHRRAYKALERLHRILEPVRSEVPFQRPAAVLAGRARLFTELRQALRLHVKPTESPSAPAPAATAELRDVQQSIKSLTRSLRKRRPARGPAQDVREAIDVVLKHFERHGRSLWGHAIRLPAAAGGGIRLVDRTNLALEGFFHGFKHDERRRSGRKVLTQDLESFPANALLATNLRDPDYVTILCQTLDELPRAFAELDVKDRAAALPVRQRAATSEQSADIVSSSLPAVDRKLVRSKPLLTRLHAAARSRAPRRSACAN